MHLHHDKHHAAYVTKLNGAIEKHPELGSKSPEDLLRNLNALPEDVRGVIRNNGGGHVNHTMFWQIMGQKKGGDPTGAVADAINKTFGGFDAFKEKFEAGRRKSIRQRLGLAGEDRTASSRSPPPPTRTIQFPMAKFRSWAMTFGSTPIT